MKEAVGAVIALSLSQRFTRVFAEAGHLFRGEQQ